MSLLLEAHVQTKRLRSYFIVSLVLGCALTLLSLWHNTHEIVDDLILVGGKNNTSSTPNERQQQGKARNFVLARKNASSSSTSSDFMVGSHQQTDYKKNDNDSNNYDLMAHGPSEGLLVMVMGEASNYVKWDNLWNNKSPQSENDAISLNLFGKNISNAAPLSNRTRSSFIYASYDERIIAPPPPPATTNSSKGTANFLHSRTIFIPGTTWTEGRNILAQEALRNERIRGQTYKYWVFLDDDIEFVCKKNENYERRRGNTKFGGGKVTGSGNSETVHGQYCWNMFLDFLDSDDLVPQKVTTVTVRRGRYSKEYSSVSKPDAIVAAFKRESVPFLLPYATLQPGESQFTSQKVLYCVMKTCLEQSAMYIPYIHVKNEEHRNYQRGFNISSFMSTVVQNYNRYLDLQHCITPEYHVSQRDDVLTAQSVQELDNMIPGMNSTCDILQHRFYDWQRGLDEQKSR